MQIAKNNGEYECAFEPGPAGFEALMRRAQRAYAERDIETYMAAWRPYYKSFQVTGSFEEDLAGLRAKLEREFSRYSLSRMDFEVKKLDVMGNIGAAVLTYNSELDGGGVKVSDERTNLILGEFDGERWWLVSKIVIRCNTKSIPV